MVKNSEVERVSNKKPSDCAYCVFFFSVIIKPLLSHYKPLRFAASFLIYWYCHVGISNFN